MMRIGTTSYIIPADIATNVRALAGRVQDVELVIFESPECGTNYPDADTVRELGELAEKHDLTYTVHLPVDGRLADPDGKLEAACSVIRTTAALKPFAYVVHLDGHRPWGPHNLEQWLINAQRTLAALAEAAGGLDQLCVENVENQSPELLSALLDFLPVPCCVDVGHLWKLGLDPLPLMDRWLPRARVVHLHGVAEEDHVGLSVMTPDRLDPVVERLCTAFHGVLTLEVFSQHFLDDCLTTFQQARQRVAAGLADAGTKSFI